MGSSGVRRWRVWAVWGGLVAVLFGVPGATASAQVERPRVVGSLGTVFVVVVGSPVDVDVAGVFAGSVESYSAVSAYEGVVTVSGSGSKVTFTGVSRVRNSCSGLGWV